MDEGEGGSAKQRLLQAMEQRPRRRPAGARGIEDWQNPVDAWNTKDGDSFEQLLAKPARRGAGGDVMNSNREAILGRICQALTSPAAGPKLAGTNIGRDGLTRVLAALEKLGGSGLSGAVLNFLRRPGGEQVCGVSVEQLRKLDQMIAKRQGRPGAGELAREAPVGGARLPQGPGHARRNAPQPNAAEPVEGADPAAPWVQSLAGKL